MYGRIFLLLTATVSLLVSIGAVAGQLEGEIDHLLNYVRTSDLVFVRNGREHNPQDAYEHMKRKYDHFRKKIDSAESFIEYSASKSTMSSKRYTIRLPDGRVVYSQDYLLNELERYRQESTRQEPP